MSYRLNYNPAFGVTLNANKSRVRLQDINISELRALFVQHQLLVLRGFETFNSSEDFSNYCTLWGELSIWPFGSVLELVQQATPDDHIFDNSYMPLHWDGMYRPQIPEYQIFHCINAPSPELGGRTTFSNTLLALKNASQDEKTLWSKVSGHYERTMEFYNSRTQSPIIARHPYRDFNVIRYNEPHDDAFGHFINPPKISFQGIEAKLFDDFQTSLRATLYAPENFYAHPWQPGDVVIADNFCLLHGREAFRSHAPRHLQRVQVLSNPPFNNPGLESYQ